MVDPSFKRSAAPVLGWLIVVLAILAFAGLWKVVPHLISLI